jgi:hypothetical protein
LRDHCCTEGTKTDKDTKRQIEKERERGSGGERERVRGKVEGNKSERKKYNKKQNMYYIQQ